MPINRVVHRQNPFVLSREADARSRRDARKHPEKLSYFSAREVLNPDGSFPFGEGYLYNSVERTGRSADWRAGRGKPGATASAGHRGSKPQQQDAFGAWHFEVGGQPAALIIAADGVSASGKLASPAAKKATDTFARVLQAELRDAPTHAASRHAFVEQAMAHAAFAANFEVLRHVLLDRHGDGAFDAGDRAALRNQSGVDLPTGKVTPVRMRTLAGRLSGVVDALAATDRTALTTFAAAVVVDNDLYTYSCGDAVVGLYRPTEPVGKRLIHLTHRDQQVVELYRDGADVDAYPDVYENVITDSLGGGAQASGTIRRFPNLLEPGDELLAVSDGIGPRGKRGLDRERIEAILGAHADPTDAARTLVREQLAGLRPGEYQDNISVALLTVE